MNVGGVPPIVLLTFCSPLNHETDDGVVRTLRPLRLLERSVDKADLAVTPHKQMRNRKESRESQVEGRLIHIYDCQHVRDLSCTLLTQKEYRTLSIGVTDTIQHRYEPGKGHVRDIADLEWHKISAADAVRRLRSSETQGLDNNQWKRRIEQDGKNILSPPPTHRFRKMY